MTLYDFYGETCPHCIEMMPLLDKLEKEGYKVERLEVWNNPDNAKTLEKYDKGLCGGVPFFYNTESGEHICGSTDFESLKSWAEGKKKD